MDTAAPDSTSSFASGLGVGVSHTPPGWTLESDGARFLSRSNTVGGVVNIVLFCSTEGVSSVAKKEQ